MKVIKPQRLGLLTRAFENGDRFYFVVSALELVAFDHPDPLHEVEIWQLVARELGGATPLDACMPKERGEVLVSGKAFARGGVPQKVVAVRASVGAIDKSLWVVGDRHWTLGGAASEPEPFVSKDVSFANAFGGEGFAANPIGKGARKIGDAHPLPNVEDPRALVKSPSDAPAPAGFGPYDFTWPQRYSKVGTYDREWQETRFPGFAKDMDWGIWNSAPVDQIVKGYFAGDERFAFENMNERAPMLEGSLPRRRARAFVNLATKDGEELREIATRIDTLHFFPNAAKVAIIHRGMIEIGEDDASDVQQLVVALEDEASRRDVDHYRAVLAKRLDKRRGAIEALRDLDLMPPSRGDRSPAPFSDVEAIAKSERLLAKNQMRRAELQLASVREDLERRGLDASGVATTMPAEPEPPDVERLAEFLDEQHSIIEQAKAEAEAARKEAETRARAVCEKGGLDYDAMMKTPARRGPPKLVRSPEATTTRLGEARTESVEASLVDAERELIAAYRKTAHHLDPIVPVEATRATALRASLEERLRRGEGLVDRDLTGADLRGVDLAGADLHGALLEGADLRGAKLDGANLRDVVLAGADLRDASFIGADLGGANLGRARCDGASFDRASLVKAVLAKASFDRASFVSARLDRANLGDASFAGAVLRDVAAPGLLAMNVKLGGAFLENVDLTRATFLECDASGVDFRRATLISATFIGGSLEGAIFDGGKLDNLRCVKETNLARASFKGASVVRANLRGTTLDGADFTRASMEMTDLSGASCRGACFRGADLRTARFVKTDLGGARFGSARLIEAILQKAKLQGADFTGANLFRADLARVEADEATTLDGAFVKQVRVVRRDRARRADESR